MPRPRFAGAATSRHIIGAAASALLACASAPSTAPHAMSATEHDAAARRADESSAEHRARYDPGAFRQRTCPPRYGTLAPVCWADAWNPTAGHLEEAARRHDEAERHLAASRALRDAENAACAGVASEDREWSPFEHASDIVSVEPVVRDGKTVGARATFRTVPGLTPQTLRRIAACHAARNAVLGHDRVEMATCPLAVPEVEVDAAFESARGVSLELLAADARAAREILARARAAATPPRSP